MAQASMTLPQMSLLSEPGAVVDPALQSSWPDQRFALESHSARSQTTTPDPVQSGGRYVEICGLLERAAADQSLFPSVVVTLCRAVRLQPSKDPRN